jgi:DNA-binding PadR family transcriptional regulator
VPLSEPVYQILLSLSDRALHGYAVIQDVRDRTGGAVELTASTLYGALKRLRGDGLVREVERPPAEADDDPRRRYYTLTGPGREVLRAEALRLRRAVDAAVRKGLVSSRGAGEG